MSLGSALQQAHIAITSPSKLRQRNSSRPAGLCVGQHHGHHDGHFREVKHCVCCSKATTQLQNDVSPASTPYSQLPALKHFPTSHDGCPSCLAAQGMYTRARIRHCTKDAARRDTRQPIGATPAVASLQYRRSPLPPEPHSVRPFKHAAPSFQTTTQFLC